MTQLAAKLFLFLLTLSVTAGAGGTIAAGHGMGIHFPRSDDEITWSAYGAPLTVQMRDIVALATATIDAETDGFRLLHEFHPETRDQHVYFSFIGGDADPRCSDDTPGGCTLGTDQCLEYVTDGPYKLCTKGKIKIFVANIQASVLHKGEDFNEKLHSVVRHEWVHSLGFADGVGGPSSNGMNKFTECQLAQMRAFEYDANVVGWTVVNLAECE